MRRITLCLCALFLLPACTEPAETKPAADAKTAQDGAKGDAKADAPKDDGLPKAAELLAASVDAVGGADVLESVKNFHLKGSIAAPKQNLSGEVETWWEGGDFYMVQTIPGLGINRSGKKGDVIWAEEPINGLRKLEGKEAEQHLWASSLMLAADWQQFFDSAETTGERELEGKKVYDIKLTSKSGAALTLTLDAKSKLMVEQSFEVHSPMGSMPVTIASLDYRDVSGMKIPHKQVTDASLMKLTQELTVVEINPGVDASKFGLPTEDIPVVSGKPDPAPAKAPDAPAEAAPK
ncbi:MAG: hypothetical protein AAGA54_16020 [Myxococcota bacterium]